MSGPGANRLGRPLTASERRASQRGYSLFYFVNGASYMCLGENVMVLFAAQLDAPNAVVSLLGAMLYVGYAMLPLGLRRTAQAGAARSLADFWVARNLAALFTATAAFAALASPVASWAMLVIGSFLFYGFRAAGYAVSTPLVGDISSPDEAPGVIGRAQALFNASAVAALAAITLITAHLHGPFAFAAIIVVGSLLGIGASRFMRGVRESGEVGRAAARPLLPGLRAAFAIPGVRRLAAAWFLLNLCTMTTIPMSMLALKRGCGLDASRALLCACAQFAASIATSTVNGRLCRRFGPNRLLVAVALSFVAVPFAWMFFPGGVASALAAGLLLFLWLGAFYSILTNATQAYFLRVCPDKALQVPGSVGLNLATGAGAGLAGSALGAALVSMAARLAPDGGIAPFCLYFPMLLPATAIALVSALRLKSPANDIQFNSP